MARRSVTNDRYRVEQKGHTRKSASAAKPKREAGASVSDVAAKKDVKKKPSLWKRGSARPSLPPVPSTPRMKQLRRYWWILIGVAIVLAVAMIPIQRLKNATLDSVLFGVYAAALGGALYLEFGPLRKARLAAVAAAKAKDGKAAKGPAKASAKAKKKVEPEPALATRPAQGPTSLGDRMRSFLLGTPKAPGGVLETGDGKTSDDEAAAAADEAPAKDDESGK